MEKEHRKYINSLEELNKERKIEQVHRLRWIEEAKPKFEHGFLFLGGEGSSYIYHESQIAFISGLDYLCAISCLSFIEKELIGNLRKDGLGAQDLDHAGAYSAIEKGREEGFISEEEADLMDRVRKTRNPLAHFRTGTEDDSLMNRAANQNVPPYQLTKEDAKRALVAMFRLAEKVGIGKRYSSATKPAGEQTTLDFFL